MPLPTLLEFAVGVAGDLGVDCRPTDWTVLMPGFGVMPPSRADVGVGGGGEAILIARAGTRHRLGIEDAIAAMNHGSGRRLIREAETRRPVFPVGVVDVAVAGSKELQRAHERLAHQQR